MPALRLVLVVVFAFVVSGCINSGTLVKVKPNGSGTIEQTLLMNTAAIKGLMTSMAGMKGEVKEKTSGNLFDEAEFKRTAERIGARPVSLTPIKEGGFEGAKAIFAFDDITKIRVDQDPQMAAGAGKLSAKAAGSSPIRFGFSKEGGSSVLTVIVDEKTKMPGAKVETPPTPTTPEKLDPAMMQMIKAMFQGFKVAIDLEVEGKIVKTNADYVNGSRVTLLELDMGALLENEAALTALQSKVGPGASIADVKPYLKDIKGVKINHPSITIEYR